MKEIKVDTTQITTSDKIELSVKDAPKYLISPEKVLFVKLFRGISIKDD